MTLVEERRPDLYGAILFKIGPHSLDSVLNVLECHLRRRVSDLSLFNRHVDAVPEFVWAFVKHLKFPTPGDAYGIHLTCRITKSDTQGTLDSKHLQSSDDKRKREFNADKEILNELSLFSTQTQVFEFANRHRYATVFTTDISIEELSKKIPDACRLERGGPYNKGRNACGEYGYLSSFKYILAEDRGSVKVLYPSLRDLFEILRRVPLEKMVAFSDVRILFQKCGIPIHFFNVMKIVDRQLFLGNGSVYEKDVSTLVKYQCRSGKPLPLTRDGLAKNPDRTPLEVLSFEAPKKNFARLSTSPCTRDRWFSVETSAEKIFFGQQFNEGTGYTFALLPTVDMECPKNCQATRNLDPHE